MLTMLPRPRGDIARSPACMTKKTPRTLTAITRSNSSGVVSTIVPAKPRPALHTTVVSGVGPSTSRDDPCRPARRR